MNDLIEKINSLGIAIRLGIVGALVLLWGAYLYVETYTPSVDALELAKTNKDTLAQKVMQANNTNKNLKSIEKEIAEIEKNIDKLQDSLPKDVETEKILGNFTEYSREAGIEITRFAPSPIGEIITGEKFGALRIAVNLKGTYPQILSFLDRILALPRVVTLDNIQFGKESLKQANLTTTTISNIASGPVLTVKAEFLAYAQNVPVASAAAMVHGVSTNAPSPNAANTKQAPQVPSILPPGTIPELPSTASLMPSSPPMANNTAPPPPGVPPPKPVGGPR